MTYAQNLCLIEQKKYSISENSMIFIYMTRCITEIGNPK